MKSMQVRNLSLNPLQLDVSRNHWRGRVLALSLAISLATTAMPSLATSEEPVTGDKGSDMLVDLVVMRPLGLASTVVGAAVFVVALPFTLPTGSVKTSAHEMVVRPAEYTFNRPLGELHHCGADRHSCGGP